MFMLKKFFLQVKLQKRIQNMSSITIELSLSENDIKNIQNELENNNTEYMDDFLSRILKLTDQKTMEIESVITRINNVNPFSQTRIKK